MYLKSNLKLLRKRKEKTQQEVADETNLSRENVKSYESGTNPPLEALITLCRYYKLSMDTLVTINLEKLSEAQFKDLDNGFDVYMKGTKLRVIPISVDSQNRNNIEVVPVKARAGYTRGYSDPEFIGSLDVFQIPFLSHNKKFRAFQLDGPSMTPIPDKAWVIGEYVENWQNIQSGKAYVLILNAKDDFVFKVVYNQVRQKKNLLLKSLNREFQDYEVPITEVLEVWQFVYFMSSEMPEPTSDVEAIFQKLIAIEKKVS